MKKIDKIFLMIIACVALAVVDFALRAYLVLPDLIGKTDKDYTDYDVYGTEFEGVPYLVFVNDGDIVGIVHDPSDYME